jgi:hypothetical protein
LFLRSKYKWIELSVEFFERKRTPQNSLQKCSGEENQKRIIGSKVECATSIMAPSIKLKLHNFKLLDSDEGVASSTYPIRIE